MSFHFWDDLPENFLRMKYRSFRKLAYDVQQLIIELAKDQKFRCALCREERNLIIEHDRDPEEGPWHRYTIYNIRGLACSKCNFHLMLYEKQENGDYINWENSYPQISGDEYEDYIYFYRNRVYPLVQQVQEKRAGCGNPWRRRHILKRFDEWRYEGGERPLWYRRYKEAQESFTGLLACIEYLKEQFAKPNFEPSDDDLRAVALVDKIIEKLRTASKLTAAAPQAGVAVD